MSAEKDQNAATKPEDSECEIIEIRVKKEVIENIDGEQVASSDKSSYQSTTCSGCSSIKRKRSKAPPGKPPYSYVALITMAIKSSPWRKMTLAEICEFIAEKFPFYRTSPLNWKGTIRQYLTLNDCFVKLPRYPHERNRGHYWTVDPASNTMFADGSFRRRKRVFTREFRPLPLERANVPGYDAPAQSSVPAVPYYPRVPVIPHTFTSQRPEFTMNNILATQPTLLTNPVPAIPTYPPTSQIQFVDNRFQSNAIPYHPEVIWSSPLSYTVPERTFSYPPSQDRHCQTFSQALVGFKHYL